MLEYNKVKSALEHNNYNLAATAKYLNVKYVTLHSFVKRNDIPFNSNKKPIPPKDILKEAYDRLGSVALVAKEFNATKAGIFDALNRYRIPYKTLVRYDCDHDFFSRDNEASFYVAGFIAADGCVKHRKNKSGSITYELQICLAEKDKHLVYLIRDLLKSNNPIRHSVSKKDNTRSVSMTIVSAKMAKDLSERFNIVPRKSLIYQFPTQIENHPLIHHFMRGYNDGDGSYFYNTLKKNKKTRQIYFSLLGTPNFLTKYREILEKNCQIVKRNYPIRMRKNIGCLDYGGNSIVTSITNFLYKDATIYLQRKYDIAKEAEINSDNCISGLKKINKIGVEKIIELYNQEKSLTKIASILKTSTSRLRYFFKQNNIHYDVVEQYSINENIFDKVNKDSAYVIGFLTGSGVIDNLESRIKFSSKDKENLINVKNILNYNGKIRESLSKDKSNYFFVISSDKMKNILINQYGISAGISDKKIPRAIKESQYLNNFINGFNDSMKDQNNKVINRCKKIIKEIKQIT